MKRVAKHSVGYWFDSELNAAVGVAAATAWLGEEWRMHRMSLATSYDDAGAYMGSGLEWSPSPDVFWSGVNMDGG